MLYLRSIIFYLIIFCFLFVSHVNKEEINIGNKFRQKENNDWKNHIKKRSLKIVIKVILIPRVNFRQNTVLIINNDLNNKICNG